MKLAVIGASGFLGSVMAEVASTSPGIALRRVTRATYAEAQKEGGYDFVVNAAMPSSRFWAENNPDADFRETVEKTHRIKHDFAPAKIIQISSVSARCQRDRTYGRHKLAAEAIVDDGRNLVVRLGPLYHESLSKGVVVDMLLHRPVFVAGESVYAFTPLAWAAAEILRRLDDKGVIEIGARGGLRLADLSSALGSTSSFEGAIDHQVFEGAPADAPAAEDVIMAATSWKSRATGWRNT
jgi:dTDP-4-dehydrorhamnose reductase